MWLLVDCLLLQQWQQQQQQLISGEATRCWRGCVRSSPHTHTSAVTLSHAASDDAQRPRPAAVWPLFTAFLSAASLKVGKISKSATQFSATSQIRNPLLLSDRSKHGDTLKNPTLIDVFWQPGLILQVLGISKQPLCETRLFVCVCVCVCRREVCFAADVWRLSSVLNCLWRMRTGAEAVWNQSWKSSFIHSFSH